MNKSRTFKEWMQVLKDYCLETGNTLGDIKRKDTYKGIAIGEKIKTLRKDYRDKKLTDDEIAILESIGMIWKVVEHESFDKWIQILTDYCNETGTTLADVKIFSTYCKGYNIGTKIASLRAEYKNNKLSLEEIEALENLGMIWNNYTPFYEWVNVFEEYCRENHCTLADIKRTDKHGDIKVGEKIQSLRRAYKVNTLGEQEIAILESMGMAWTDEEARAIKKSRIPPVDNHLKLYKELVEAGYTAPYDRDVLIMLVSHLEERRQYIVKSYYGLDKEKVSGKDLAKELNITPERVCQLRWSAIEKMIRNEKKTEKVDKSWEKWKIIFKDYCSETGNTLGDIKSTERYKRAAIGDKIAQLRHCYKNNNLEPEKVTFLESLGMSWSYIKIADRKPTEIKSNNYTGKCFLCNW